ncbi:MAG TPA: hypothetical protein VNI02_02755, partial [Blastocatellia bacterium]|nr:hypothetical protein [Blastocatellia bacterium]
MQIHDSSVFDRLIRAALSLCLLMLLAQTANAAPPSQWTPRGAGGGGALFAPSFSPHNANEV